MGSSHPNPSAVTKPAVSTDFNFQNSSTQISDSTLTNLVPEIANRVQSGATTTYCCMSGNCHINYPPCVLE